MIYKDFDIITSGFKSIAEVPEQKAEYFIESNGIKAKFIFFVKDSELFIKDDEGEKNFEELALVQVKDKIDKNYVEDGKEYKFHFYSNKQEFMQD